MPEDKKNFRIERDGLGEMPVPAERLWGAVTERSRLNFPIGSEKMPAPLIHALIQIKLAAARANARLGYLDPERAELIETICLELLANPRPEEFPLVVWQTGSGTQSNMNVNEVIARLGNQARGEDGFLHPNDHVNRSQSSNDCVPTAIHIATRLALDPFFEACEALIAAFRELAERERDTLKVGRTHLQDAVPVTFGQEVGGWASALEADLAQVKRAALGIEWIAQGGTAVGTGLNAPEGFAEEVARELSQITGHNFRTAPDKFASLSFQSPIANVHAALKILAMDLHKIADDLRWLNSGPRAGLGEIVLPANEPGSSIMPGKVNPTQCEAVAMIVAQVFGNEATVSFAASQGKFQLNVYLPVIAYNTLQSIELLTDGMNSFRLRAVEGLTVRREHMRRQLDRTLMLVTALSPHIGYIKASEVAHYAEEHDLSLEEAAVKLGIMSSEEFRALVKPETMV